MGFLDGMIQQVKEVQKELNKNAVGHTKNMATSKATQPQAGIPETNLQVGGTGVSGGVNSKLQGGNIHNVKPGTPPQTGTQPTQASGQNNQPPPRIPQPTSHSPSPQQVYYTPQPPQVSHPGMSSPKTMLIIGAAAVVGMALFIASTK
jgi:hypothetical protein